MKFKKIAFVTVLVLCVSSVSSVFAEEVNMKATKTDSYQVRWENVTSIDTYVEQTSSGLNAYAIIIPNDDEKVKGTLYLQKYKNGYWSTVKYWKFSGIDYTEVCKSYNSSSGTYRTKVFANVGGEYVSMYSSGKEID